MSVREKQSLTGGSPLTAAGPTGSDRGGSRRVRRGSGNDDCAVLPCHPIAATTVYRGPSRQSPTSRPRRDISSARPGHPRRPYHTSVAYGLKRTGRNVCRSPHRLVRTSTGTVGVRVHGYLNLSIQFDHELIGQDGSRRRRGIHTSRYLRRQDIRVDVRPPVPLLVNSGVVHSLDNTR